MAWIKKKKKFLNGQDRPDRIVRVILNEELLLGIDQLVLVHDTMYWSDIVDQFPGITEDVNGRALGIKALNTNFN